MDDACERALCACKRRDGYQETDDQNGLQYMRRHSNMLLAEIDAPGNHESSFDSASRRRVGACAVSRATVWMGVLRATALRMNISKLLPRCRSLSRQPRPSRFERDADSVEVHASHDGIPHG